MYLQAQVECQVYYDSESSFGVYDVKELSTGKIQSLVGVLPDLLPGEIVEGEVIEQTRYNPYMKENELQWKAQGSMLPTLPVTEHAIEQFKSQVDSKEKTILVNYPDINTCVTYARENLDSLLHAYAITIHKSQGSEYPCVIMALPRGAYRMMFKNLVYTGVTRARKKCMIVGDPGSISKALTNIRQNTRCSLLSYNLCQCFPNEISLDLG
jgi:hypothetical protein